MTQAMADARAMVSGANWGNEYAVPQLLEGIGLSILAVAEQQQLANRIALAEHMRKLDLDFNHMPARREGISVWEYSDSHLVVHREIAELLR